MKKWLAALWAETLSWFLWSLSALSTFSTFFFHGTWSGKLRLAFGILFVLSFAWANFRVFQKQERRIAKLREVVVAHGSRAAELRITPLASSYILRPVGNVPNADFNGAFVNLQMTIENTGRRNSTVNRYDVEIAELNAHFQNLEPQEGRTSVQGRHAVQGLDPRRILSRTGLLRIDAESATDRGELLFLLPDLTLERFTSAGLRMSGEERRFGTIRCRLTLTDTTGSAAAAEFELREA